MTDEEQLEPPIPQEANSEIEDWKDKYLRLLAEQENLRKRAQKEKQETLLFGVENVIAEFIPVIDQFDHAISFAGKASEEVKNWAQGFSMVLAQFKEILLHHGITPIHSVGVYFDPYLHEAVETVEDGTVPEGTILQEFTRGYRSKTRTIRPARVKVTRKPVKGAEEEINVKE